MTGGRKMTKISGINNANKSIVILNSEHNLISITRIPVKYGNDEIFCKYV